MKLKSYINKEINIVTIDGEIFEGKVNDYFHADENDNSKESFVLDTSDGEAIEFYADEIKEIKTIN